MISKIVAAAFLLGALAAPAFGQSAQLCQGDASPFVVATDATSVRVADILLYCGGGTPTPAQNQVPQVNITLVFSSNVTSRLLAPGYLEAFLIIDEPGAGNLRACVGDGGICAIFGTGNGVGTYSGAVGRPNVFQARTGTVQNPNQANAMTFAGVPLDPRGAGTRTLRFTNLKVNANGAAEIQAAIIVTGQTNLAIQDPQGTVANAQLGMTVAGTLEGAGGRVNKLTLNYAETFPGLFKTRSAAAFVNNDTSPAPIAQSLVGIPLTGFETSFYNPAFPNTSQGNLGVAGLADTGTRIAARLDEVPAGVGATVPTVLTFGSNGVARLINTDLNGAGPFSPASTGTVTNVNGTLFVVYEILRTNSQSLETIPIPFTLTYTASAPAVRTLTGAATLAPVSNVVVPSQTAPQPRFNYTYFFEVTLPPDVLSITTTTLPAGSMGRTYSQNILATGGTAPYTFSVSAGRLPAGLTLSAAGLLSGSPTETGTFDFTVAVRDAANTTVTRALSLLINGPLTITTNSLPAAQVGVPYTSTVQATGGVPPYRFSLTGVPPAGFTFSNTGTLSGTAVASGNALVAVSVSDSTGFIVSKQLSLTVNAASAFLLLSSTSLTFDAIVDGDRPAPQSLNIVSASEQEFEFTVRSDGGSANLPAPIWLKFSPSEASAPNHVTVSVDQANFRAGTFTARLLISTTLVTSGQTLEVTVTLRLRDAAPKLEALPRTLSITRSIQSPGAQTKTILLRNAGGGGSIPFQAAKASSSSTWLRLPSPASGQAGARVPAAFRIDVDSTGLRVGFYRETIRFTWTGGVLETFVVLWVAPQGAILDLETTGLRFNIRDGSGTSATRRVQVFNRGQAGTSIQWRAEIIGGSDWLQVSPASGVATPDKPGVIVASLLPVVSKFEPGPRYALVRVSGGTGVVSSPQYFAAVLNVMPEEAAPPLDFDTVGVVLRGTSRSRQPLSYTFQAATSGPNVFFQTSEMELSGEEWLSVDPDSGILSPDRNTGITAEIDTSQLNAGVYEGEIGISAGATFQILRILLILTDPAADAPDAARTAVCVPARMSLVPTRFPGFSVFAGWQEVLAVEVRDNCQNAVTNATVIARFTNGDAERTLDDSGLGNYTTTWTPGTPTAHQGVIFRANAPGLEEAVEELSSTVNPNDVPSLAPGGVIHNLFPEVDGKFSPGLVIQIYGTGLTAKEDLGGVIPLATSLGDVDFVLVGGSMAPMYYAGGNQLVAQIPAETPVNAPQRIGVSVRGTFMVGDSLRMVPVKPGVVAFLDGRLVAQKPDASLVSDSNPARRGDILAMYLVGMGATNPQQKSGSPAGADRLVEPVTVTIGGLPVTLQYSGTTPGGIGLYQINFVVPANAPLNTPLEVVVTQGGEAANVTTLTVR